VRIKAAPREGLEEKAASEGEEKAASEGEATRVRRR